MPSFVGLAQWKGAWVMLDSYQALSTMLLDVKKLKVDFLVGGVLKYLLASTGLACVITSSRDGNLRNSPHFYDNLSDVDRLLDYLTKHKELLV